MAERNDLQARLRARDDVPNEHIDAIIMRAVEMEQQAKARAAEVSSVEQVRQLGRQLEIDQRFVDAAIAEQREKANRKPWWREPIWHLRLAIGGGAVLLVLAMVWCSSPPSSPPQQTVRVATAPPPVVPPAPAPDVAPEPKPGVAPPETPPAPTDAPSADPSDDDGPWPDDAPEADDEPEADEGPPEEAPPSAQVPQDTTDLSDTPEGRSFVKFLRGEWVLDAWRASTQGKWLDAPVSNRADQDRERWSIRPGQRFSHRVSDLLSFSGQFRLRRAPAELRISDAPGPTWVLQLYDLASTIPSLDRPYDEFLAAAVDDGLLLHYLGHPVKLPATVPQGARFRKLR